MARCTTTLIASSLALAACVKTPAPAALPAPAPAATAATGRQVSSLPDFAVLAAGAMPAVVSIQTRQKGPDPRALPPGADPLGLFRFFGRPAPREFARRGVGSGFVVDAEGLILTNAHVVENADVIEAIWQGGEGSEIRRRAKVVGEAPDHDVALLRVEAKSLATLAMGDSEGVRIGDWVMAVGNPFGLDHSVSVGIISAKDRRDVSPSGREGLYDFLQTDASINPGNSGGPLLALSGEVIGINAAINAQGQGIGFAIPINMVRDILPQLRSGAPVTRSWLGMTIQPVSPELAESFGLAPPRGALVSEVIAGAPADAAGLRPGDIVVGFDGRPIQRAGDLQLRASLAGAGKTIVVEIWRDRRIQQVRVRLAARGEASGAPTGGRGQPSITIEAVGASLATLPAPLRAEVGRPGVLVAAVADRGAANRAGLQPGDVLVEVGGEGVKDAAAAAALLRRLPAAASVRLRIWRQGHQSYLALRRAGGDGGDG